MNIKYSVKNFNDLKSRQVLTDLLNEQIDLNDEL